MIDEFNIPETRKEVLEKLEADVKSNLPNSKPQLKPSFLNAILTGFSGLIFDFYAKLRILIGQMFPYTEGGLERWAAIYSVERLSATQSKKNIVFNGTLGVVIPQSTKFTYNGLSYSSIYENIVSLKTMTPTSVVRTADIVRVSFSSSHNLGQNTLITMSGWSPSDFNVVDTQINILNTTQFEYTLAGTAGSATGGNSSWTNSLIQILSDDSGSATNIPIDTSVSIQVPIINLDTSGFSTFDDVLTANDEETDDSLRERLLEKIGGLYGNFSISLIKISAKQVSGTTRVWVQPTTPEVGQVSMYFVRDGDSNIIPSAEEVQNMKDYLINNEDTSILSSQMLPEDFLISSPTAVNVDIQISSLSPNTQDMRDNLTLSIKDYFKKYNNVNSNLIRNDFLSYLLQTSDNQGNFPTLVLDNPSGDIIIGLNQIPILGTITFI